MKKGCWWNENAQNGKDTASLENSDTPAADATDEPSITGMLIQSDEGEAVPADPTQWLYSMTKREYVHNNFLIDSRAALYVNRVWSTAREEYKEDMEWNSDQQRVTSSRRRAIRRFSRAHEMVSTYLETFRSRPRMLDYRGLSSQWDKCATEATSSRSAVPVGRYSMNLLAIELNVNVLVVHVD